MDYWPLQCKYWRFSVLGYIAAVLTTTASATIWANLWNTRCLLCLRCTCLSFQIMSRITVLNGSLNVVLPSHTPSYDSLEYCFRLVKHFHRALSKVFGQHHALVGLSTHRTWWCWCATLTYIESICRKLKSLCRGWSRHLVTLTFGHLQGSFVPYFSLFCPATPRKISRLNWV